MILFCWCHSTADKLALSLCCWGPVRKRSPVRLVCPRLYGNCAAYKENAAVTIVQLSSSTKPWTYRWTYALLVLLWQFCVLGQPIFLPGQGSWTLYACSFFPPWFACLQQRYAHSDSRQFDGRLIGCFELRRALCLPRQTSCQNGHFCASIRNLGESFF